jgi:hypothetical protein
MSARRERLRTCACCPNQCRSSMDPGSREQIESVTPSGLALIALAVLDGELALDAQCRAALGRTAQARPCVALCPYGYDIPATIDELVAEFAGPGAGDAIEA